MSWKPLNISAVFLSPDEKTALDRIDAGASQGTDVLKNVIGEFRDCCVAGGRAISTTEWTIPDLAKVHVINRTRWQWLCSFPALKALQTKDRKDLNDAAEEFFNRVASGEQNVPPPEAGENPRTGNWNSENRVDMRTTPTVRPRTRTSTENANPEND